MTEKRFTYENHKVKDNLTGEIHSSNMVSVNVLNALNEENEQLKQENKGLQSELEIWKKDITHSNNIINRLNDENEQLKQENEMLKTTIGRNEAYINQLTNKGKWTH